MSVQSDPSEVEVDDGGLAYYAPGIHRVDLAAGATSDRVICNQWGSARPIELSRDGLFL